MSHLQNQSWLAISRSALRHNANLLRQITGPAAFGAVIKSNAYGHGFLETARTLEPCVDWFCVNTLSEALDLYQINQHTPCLVMGLNGQDLQLLADQDPKILKSFLRPIHVAVSDPALACDWLNRYPELQLHLKIDSGLSRLGCNPDTLLQQPEQLQDLASRINPQSGRPNWTGLMTHFANVEDVSEQGYAQAQLARFTALRQELKRFQPALLCHTAASAASLLLPAARLDLVRCGIALYGLWPSNETRLSCLSQFGQIPELRPALRWFARIAHTHRVPAGSSIGYGCTRRVEQDTTIAVVPVGYYEGYDRLLSNQAYVLINDQRAPVLGRVSMNMITIDVSLIPAASPGTPVLLLGNGEHDQVSAEQLAAWSGTINYEVVTRILPAIERRLVD
ncbi:MAG: alanine racemase [Leptospiraceae bacterium]|nr:alanine racemase [Leptospiraceae bacterium]